MQRDCGHDVVVDVEAAGHQRFMVADERHPTGAADELGLDLAWSELVVTDVFNSNKCFAVFEDRARKKRNMEGSKR